MTYIDPSSVWNGPREGRAPENSIDLMDALESVTVRKRETMMDAAKSLSSIVAGLGFKVGASPDLASGRKLEDSKGESINGVAFGWNEAAERWWERRHIALHSPIALACRVESEPFWVNANGARGIGRNDLLREINFGSFFRDQEVACRSLILVPVFMPFGIIGVVGFFPLDSEQSELSGEFEVKAPLLAQLARRFMTTQNNLEQEPIWSPRNFSISSRQAQCLYWASRGKTDFEIGLIMGISHAAVRYHISAIVDRLDCVNRAQAIYKAAQLGFIGGLG